jgi:hypothetical protein
MDVQARKTFRTRPSAAYVSYQVLRRFLNDLSLPLEPPSPTGREENRRLRTTLYFLGFLGDDGSATLALEQMARAAPTMRVQQLKSALMSRYEWLWGASAPQTYDEFVSALRHESGLHGDAFARAERFVIAAARDLELSLPFDTRNRRPKQHETSSPETATSGDAWRARARERYFNFLVGVAERQAENGTPDPDLLERIERFVDT